MEMQNQIIDLLQQSLLDNRLDTDEKHEIRQLLLTLSDDQKRYLRNQAFDIARVKLNQEGVSHLEIMRLVTWLEKVVKLVDSSQSQSLVKSRAYFSPSDHCRNAIVDLLGRARQRVDICVFTISDNHITDAIISAYERGVPVRVISDNDKANDRGSDVYALQQHGVSVCMDTSPNHMHHKFALVDQSLINGSFNWTRSATVYNQENIVVTNHHDLLPAFEATFNELWNVFSG